MAAGEKIQPFYKYKQYTIMKNIIVAIAAFFIFFELNAQAIQANQPLPSAAQLAWQKMDFYLFRLFATRKTHRPE